MKRRYFLIGFIFVFLAEIVALVVFAVKMPDFSQDTVEVNEVVQSVTGDFDSLEKHENPTAREYVVLDNGGAILYKTKEGLSESVNAAIAHRDTVVDIERDGVRVGKVIIYNDAADLWNGQKRTVVTVLSAAIALSCVVCVGYAVYLYIAIVRPFKKLRGFAERVAGGNLDIPLEMDRRNLFGAFTESFDIMRSELKKARLAEAQAQKSKKELVAKLSHDIKTPVSSIKAVAEVGLATTESGRDGESFRQIIGKADQINGLVTNLFTATLEELQQLTVTPTYIGGNCVKELMEKADYLRRAALPDMPECIVFADPLRLQQVFDNIFANSYKYAGTEISVTTDLTGGALRITIEDFGGGVAEEELPVLKEKFRRGKNAANIEGAGLGLYISDYFMREMQGELTIENGEHGLKVTVSLALSGKN